MNKRNLSLGLLIIFLSIAVSAMAKDAMSPSSMVKTTVESVLTILKSPEFKDAAKQKKLKEDIFNLVNKRFSWIDMSKRSLGQLWREQTKADQDKYVQLYTQILRQTYVDKISSGGNEKIEYGEETIKGKYAEVRTTIISDDGTKIPLYYRMIQKDKEWLVYDVVIEGVSLIKNYRSQFEEILSKSTFSEFLEKLESKVEKSK